MYAMFIVHRFWCFRTVFVGLKTERMDLNNIFVPYWCERAPIWRAAGRGELSDGE